MRTEHDKRVFYKEDGHRDKSFGRENIGLPMVLPHDLTLGHTW